MRKNKPLKELKGLEREPLGYWKGDGKVTFTKGHILCTFKTLMALFPKHKVLKSLISQKPDADVS